MSSRASSHSFAKVKLASSLEAMPLFLTARPPPASGAGGQRWVARWVRVHVDGDRAPLAGGGFGRQERSTSSLLVVACRATTSFSWAVQLGRTVRCGQVVRSGYITCYVQAWWLVLPIVLYCVLVRVYYAHLPFPALTTVEATREGPSRLPSTFVWDYGVKRSTEGEAPNSHYAYL